MSRLIPFGQCGSKGCEHAKKGGYLLIQGTVRGKVVARGNLLVDKSGNVDASVEAENVEIAGMLTGDMVAEKKVEISAGGRAVGDVRAQRILIADGAVFKGNVDMSASPNATRR